MVKYFPNLLVYDGKISMEIGLEITVYIETASDSHEARVQSEKRVGRVRDLAPSFPPVVARRGGGRRTGRGFGDQESWEVVGQSVQCMRTYK